MKTASKRRSVRTREADLHAWFSSGKHDAPVTCAPVEQKLISRSVEVDVTWSMHKRMLTARHAPLYSFSFRVVIKVRPSDRRTRADEFSKTREAERNRIPNCRLECSRLRASRS